MYVFLGPQKVLGFCGVLSVKSSFRFSAFQVPRVFVCVYRPTSRLKILFKGEASI